ncbi:tRNA (guanosine(37)-N1)-methyltransferase TrmD [Ileibacterium valens]|uniref:tRNA (guanosine(37)-N1)-methyltransferase TrmD n=1 Tax=Ileibacterium valens TaxID=1862668 RepID=UPI00272B328E|nr:tRNA (guanosine(37)-N1)-methyltransferase TrmD [Ileibacterium valens]
MKVSVLSLFPEYFQGLLNTSIISRARENGLFEFETVNFREFTKSKHGHVDDAPYGGGAGMVLMCQPLLDALKSIQTPTSKVILLSPQGQKFDQNKAAELSREDHLIFICGHYEGFDERIRDYVDMQLSLGDFVLTGGEPAAAAMCDSILRLIPGVIKEESAGGDSFSDGLLEYPQYTRPYEYEGKKVPDVLMSGHHANIEKWRHEESLKRTLLHRPDLLKSAVLSEQDHKDLARLKEELKSQVSQEEAESI